MAKDKLSEYDATAANNTVVGDVNLAENSCLPSDVNNAIREVMSHQKEAFGSATPLFVDQTNNRLGISTLSPNNKLDVNGGIVCSPNTDGKNTFELSTSAVDEGRLRIKNVDTTTVQIRAGGLSYFNGGNVAIGSTSASTVLDVEGAGVPLTINSNNSNQYKIQLLDAGTVRSYLGASSTASFVVANSSVSEAMRITSGGLVAIGNSTPDSFNANAKNLVVGTGSGSNGISIFAGNTSDSAIFFADNGSTATGQINYKHADNAFTFHTNSGTERMRIDSSGNVGIGVTPTQKLHVSGNAIVTGIARLGDGSASSPAYQFVSDTNTGMFGNGSDMIGFSTGGSERMRVNASGHINIGQSSTNIPGQGNSQAGTSLRSVGDAYFSRDGDLALNVNRNGSDGKVVSFRRGGTEGGSISVTTTSATLASSSDARLKSNIEDSASASDKIDAIQVRQFDWNETGNHQDYGLIAQELQPIEPLAVVGSPDSDEMMGIDASKLIPMLIKEIQELRSRVATLEAN